MASLRTQTVTSITESELLEALAAAATGTAPEDARTVVELAAETGMAVKRVREALRLVAAEGRLRVHAVHRPALDGRASHVPAYTITARPTAAKKKSARR